MTVAPIVNFLSEPIPIITWPFLNLNEAFPDHMTHDHKVAVKNYLEDFFH